MIDTPVTQPGSRPVRFELIDHQGHRHGPFYSMAQASEYASLYWPDQEQDETRSGMGWDIEVVP